MVWHVLEQQRPVTQSHGAEASCYHRFQALQGLPLAHWSEVLRQFTWNFISEHAMELFGFINPCKSGGDSYFCCTAAKHRHYQIRFLSAYNFTACLCGVEGIHSTAEFFHSSGYTFSHTTVSYSDVSYKPDICKMTFPPCSCCHLYKKIPSIT